MDTFYKEFYENMHLPNTLLLRLKERKAKIRKFMLYVNGVLNDTEKDINMMCEVFAQLDKQLQNSPPTSQLVTRLHGKNRRRVKFTKRISTKARSSNDAVVVPETVPYNADDSMRAQTDLIVQETCTVNDSLQLSPTEKPSSACHLPTECKQDETTGHSSLDDDETIGLPLEGSSPALHDNTEKMDSLRTSHVSCGYAVSQQKPGHESKSVSHSSLPNHIDEQQESSFLSPVTTLVNNVLGSKSKQVVNEISKESTHPRVSSTSSTGSDKAQPKKKHDTQSKVAIAMELTESPTLFVDSDDNAEVDEEETLFDDITELPAMKDITELPARNSSNSDKPVNNQHKKTVTCWPIGYPKPSTKGQLIVEPATVGKSRKRTRQTRLDGFLAKAALQSSMDRSNHEPLIAMKAIGSGKSLTVQSRRIAASNVKPLTLSVASGSDSEDLCDINLDVLQAHNKRSHNSTGRSTTEACKVEPGVQLSPECDRLPAKQAKHQIGDVVRGRARKQLTGYRCTQCYEYYRTLNLSEDEIQQRLNMVCRHRAVKPPMETPPNFWNMSIASLDTNQH